MKRYLPWIILGAIVVVGGIWWAIAASSTPGQAGELDAFAQCLTEKKVTFYGAWWCAHCKNQKTMFGSSAKYLPYVECSSADGKSQLPVCSEKDVKSYPTWQFGDGPLETGEKSLQQLADKSGCALPSATNTNAANGNANATTNQSTNTNSGG